MCDSLFLSHFQKCLLVVQLPLLLVDAVLLLHVVVLVNVLLLLLVVKHHPLVVLISQHPLQSREQLSLGST